VTYDASRESTREFWHRFGRRPDVAGKRVLDIGCGHGAMSIDLAQQGAEVVGVDTDASRIEWAQRNLIACHPTLVDYVTFLAQDSTQLPSDERFDLAVSKDTFEHVIDVKKGGCSSTSVAGCMVMASCGSALARCTSARGVITAAQASSCRGHMRCCRGDSCISPRGVSASLVVPFATWATSV
jgi:SAM-dependent methyltransferase